MKRLRIFLIAIVCLGSLQGFAQKMVPYTFRFEHHADTLQERRLKTLTQVTYASAVSLRLYFKGTQLGENSYLLLEGVGGAKQELHRQDLENWQFSSAYFNGNAVKVSLVEAAREKNRVHINEIKVGNAQAKQNSTARISSESLQVKTQVASSSSASLFEDNPSAKAVGRFTNGIDATGTGWIAANGAIVTDISFTDSESTEVGNGYYLDEYDIIEFNVPPSNLDGTINHPAPEDQFPLNKNKVRWRRVEGTSTDYGFEWLGFLKVKYYKGAGRSEYIGGYTIIEALPNSKGQRPGERIGEYFQVLRHNSGWVMDGLEMDVFHYSADNLGIGNQTLEKTKVLLKDPNDWITHIYDKDRFLIYDTPFVLPGFWNGHIEGAPVVYPGTNIAVGIHSEGHHLGSGPSLGTGFLDQDFRKHLGEFFTVNMTYVDQASVIAAGNGNIYQPYRTVAEGVQKAAENHILNIAQGSYNETVYISKPLKLSAPVGKVIIGASGSNARTAAGPSIPRELYMDDEPVSFNDLEEELESSATLVSSPNPFSDRTELKYTLPEETLVTVKVYDIVGNEIHTLLQTSQMKGNHSVIWDGRDKWGKSALTGMYIIKLQTGTQIRSIRVIKK